MQEDEIRQLLNHEYMEEIMLQEEEKREAQHKEESYDQEPFNRNVSTANANVQTQESITTKLNDKGEIGFRLGDFEADENYMSIGVGIADLKKIVAAPSASVRLSADKGKTVAEPKPQAKNKKSKRKAPAASEQLLLSQE
ncbi:hypothetical protein Tco_0497302 [Tanacetum coccineum]